MTKLFKDPLIHKNYVEKIADTEVFRLNQFYDQNDEHNASSYSDQDNLIIKGNNLIVLYSLKKLYASKIKLIYLDPPYNTGSDSFL